MWTTFFYILDIQKRIANAIKRHNVEIVENVALDDVILPLLAAEAVTFDEKQDVEAKEGGETAKAKVFSQYFSLKFNK